MGIGGGGGLQQSQRLRASCLCLPLSAGINTCAKIKTELSYLLFCSLLKRSTVLLLNENVCIQFSISTVGIESTSIKQVGIVVPKFLCQSLPSWVSIKTNKQKTSSGVYFKWLRNSSISQLENTIIA